MPKGRGATGTGIDGAWETDAKSVPRKRKTPAKSQTTVKRLSITLSTSAFETLDTELTTRKKQGLRANRSQFVEDAILYYLEHNK